MDKINVPDTARVTSAFDKLGAAFAQAGGTVVQGFQSLVIALQQDDRFMKRIQELVDGLTSAADIYMRDVAEPDAVVQYILQKPNHTWMGVTIYPDEAWRYEHKSDWMWWRK